MLEKLQRKLGYSFRDEILLRNALIHSSYANENRASGVESNERLEYLGDSVLGFVVAEYLYKTYPQRPEGELTRMRAEMVCEGSLAEVAATLELGSVLLLGTGEERTGGRTRASITADAMESVIAATYLDGGMEAARDLIARLIFPMDPNMHPRKVDAKTALQELVQKKKDQHLEYRELGSTGPDHDKRFLYEVLLNGKSLATGEGRSKKAAEQAAAALALEMLQKNADV